MKAKKEIHQLIEVATRCLKDIQAGMDNMTQQEIELAKSIHQQLSDLQVDGALTSPLAEQLVAKMLTTLNEIMAQCQMHDILSQRLAHVMQIHEQISTELSASDDTWQYVKVLPELLKLNMWQTCDIQKVWAMNIKMIVDSWQMIASSCRMLESEPSVYVGKNAPCNTLRKTGDHTTYKSAPHYDQLFMSAYWQQLESCFSRLKKLAQQHTYSVNREEKLDTLRGVEKSYTMKVERDILMRLLGENDLLSPEETISEAKNTDGFAELF